MPPKSKNNKSSANNTITVMDYSPAHAEEKTRATIEDCVHYKETPSVTWVNIDSVPPAKFLHELGLGFDLHPVILEDILTLNQRPKIEFMDDYIYLVVRMLYLDTSETKVLSEQVSLIIAKKFVISTQQGVAGDVFDPVRAAIQHDYSKTRHNGTDYLGYKLLDAIVNAYFKVLELYGEKMETLEGEMLTKPTTKTLAVLHDLKQEILEMRRMVWPLRELINALERGDSLLIKKSTRIYLRDVYERAIQVIDTIETHRETLTGLLDVYLSSTSNKMNSVMKVLTMIATIFMPLSFVAGVYGMNFRYMPGLESVWGFPAVFMIMALVGLGMLRYFWKKGWL